MRVSRTLVWTLAAAALALPAHADDWPQWLGPNRTGVSTETGLLKSWPAEGPKLKWKVKDLGGEAYSAPAVYKGRVYLLVAQGKDEHVLALDAKDGGKIWSTRIGKVGTNKGPQYVGPRGTPTIEGDFLYALGSAGDLACLNLAKGEVVWSKNFVSDFQGKPGAWAYSESPLIDGDNVIASPGGAANTVVALKKADGKLAWKSALAEADEAAYGSPIKIEVGGVKQVVAFLSKGVVGLNAADGTFLWRFDGPAQNSQACIPTPMHKDGLLFATTGQGKGGVARLTVENGKVTAKQIWLTVETTSQIGGYLLVGDHLYGTTGRGGTGQLQCVELATGKVTWKNPSVGPASLCVVDGLLYVRGTDGTVALVEANHREYKELGRLTQPDRSKKPAWPYPVVANGQLYLRDMDVLLCYDISAPKK